MIYFTSDWHLSDPRSGYQGQKIDLFFRSHLKTEQNFLKTLWDAFEDFQNGDVLFHLGDIVHTLDDSAKIFLLNLTLKFPNSEFYFYEGNYDTEEIIEFLTKDLGWVNLGEYGFHSVLLNDESIFAQANHYPNKANALVNLVGHIHGAWRFQKTSDEKLLINLGIDAWNYRLVSNDQLQFFINACMHHYDDNVFLK